MKMQTPYVIIRGEPKCLTRGFDRLKTNLVYKTIETIQYKKKRKFKLVGVTEYDPVSRDYVYQGEYWVDVVTGTLYEPTTGECLSSSQIKLLVE